MSFLYPYVLFAMLLPLALAVGAAASLRRSGRGWHRLVSAAHEGELVVTRPAWRTLLPALLCLAALVCAVAALARPINGYREAGALSNSRNLLLALDISRSMETQDVSPSRLEEARMAAYELIDSLPNDKIGLIVFSGTADLVVPLTYDHTALRDALEQVNRGWAGSGGTNFGLVLQKAMQDFKRSAPDGTNALVLLSDGEDTADTSRNIEKEAKENHLMVITVGVGTAAGGPIPDANGDNGLWQDAEGKHVISKLDAESLQAFAKATGGSYFQMGQHSDLADFARRAVQKLDAHEENVSLNKVPNDLFAYFAAAALVLLLLAIPLATDWKRPRRLMLLPALLLGFAAAPAAHAAADASVAAYRSGLEQATADPAKAKDAFSLALLDEDPHLQAAGHCAIGNINTRATFEELRALYEGGGEDEDAAPAAAGQPSADDLQKIVDKLKENRTPYLDALAADAAWSAAQKNLDKIDELIKKLEEEIERLKQQEQQQQEQQQQNQQNENNQQQNQQQNQDNQQSGDNEQQQQDKQQGDNKDDKQQGEQGQDDSDPQQNQGDKPEPQPEQQNDKQNDPQQDKNDKNAPQQQPEQKPEEQPQEQEAADNANDKERAEQRAASILKMHMDEEHGSPIPHLRDNNRPPKKDY